MLIDTGCATAYLSRVAAYKRIAEETRRVTITGTRQTRSVETLTSTLREVPIGYNRGVRLPWWLKMAARLVASRLPLPRIAAGLVSSHGETNLDRLIVLFETKLLLYQSLSGHRPHTYLELGPGASVARALVAARPGIYRIWLIDAGNFARRDLAYYHDIAASLTTRGLTVPDLSECRNLDDVLTACRATYLTGGLSSLRRIEDNCIDLIISEAVLEHLPRHEFPGFMIEFQRLLAPGGVALHGVDLDDHIDGGLNQLRFSRDFWERELLRRSGFYTNRLSRSDMIRHAQAAGLTIGEYYRLEWCEPPIERDSVHPDLRGWRDSDLKIRSFGLALQSQLGG